MRKNGFTLIELLAVIVILAIIALIATPIILGIINDARKESNERSVELYAAAVKNGIAAHQLTGSEVPAGTYTKETLPFDVDVDGKVECNTIDIYKDGSIYVTDCKVNDTAVDYTSGTKKYEPQYYYWGSGNIGDEITSIDAKKNVSEIDTKGKPFYLGLDVEDGKVSAAYACFKKNNETEYCLKGYDKAAFATNTAIIKDAYADVIDTDACSFEEGDSSYCNSEGIIVIAYSDGVVGASDELTACGVFESGEFECGE